MPDALCDDGSCDYSSCAGCTDPTACNYDETATIDDGSCILPDGCTDPAACNYDEAAQCDDGSCEFLPVTEITTDTPEPTDAAPATYTYQGAVGSTYAWEVTGGTIESGQGTESVVVQWTSLGANQICVTETSSEGCTGEQVCFDVDVVVTITEVQSTAISTYPNPTQDVFTLDVPLQLVNSTYTLYNQIGQVVLTGRIDAEQTTISVGGIASGYYTMVIPTANEVITTKLTVAK